MKLDREFVRALKEACHTRELSEFVADSEMYAYEKPRDDDVLRCHSWADLKELMTS